MLGAEHRTTLGLRAKEKKISSEIAQAEKVAYSEDSEDEEAYERGAERGDERGDDAVPGRQADAAPRAGDALSPKAEDALLRVLSRRNEELLVIFSSADNDHTGTIDPIEFALSLRSMGVRHEADIHELMPLFGYSSGSYIADLHELLSKVRGRTVPACLQ